MDDYEILLDEVNNEVPVIETDLLDETGLKAVYENEFIYVDKNISHLEKKICLSEEFSHHKTSVGNILDYNNVNSRKQEWRARRDSIERLIPIEKLIECFYAGCKNKYECSEYLSVTEDFFSEALKHYHVKHGKVHLYNDYTFIFNEYSIIALYPHLATKDLA